jgi:DNA-directed RNA polymerase beta' subunit
MPSVSQSQQRLMGMVHAYQKGELKNPSNKVKDVAKHIDASDAKHFAETKHEALPEKKAGTGFHRPENYDKHSLSGKNWQVWSGANDWEEATSWVWCDLDNSLNGLIRVWFRVKYPEKLKDADAKAYALRVAPTWVRCMKDAKLEDEFPSDSASATQRYFETALKHEDMKGFVRESGTDVTRWVSKSASTAPNTVPITGPEAIYHALERLDVDATETAQRDIVRTRKVSKRPRAINILNTLEGLRRNNMKPTDLMISSVPVIPAQFRPFSLMGDTFVPGDANELYRDLFKVRDAFNEGHEVLGEEGTRAARLHLYDSVKALYGYRDPVEPKTLQRGVSGFLKKITGHNPKFGFVQRQLLAKPMDSVGRGVIGVNPDLGLDEIGVPKDMAWKMYAPYIQSRLVQGGMSPAESVKAVRDRTDHAYKALERETTSRPVIYSRAPSWHKFNVIAGHPKLIDGHTIMINGLVGTGLNADHDGDAINLHVPSMDDAVQEAHEKLMPSKMLFSDREYDKVIPQPKHEQILGLATATYRTPGMTHQFPDRASAMAGVRSGKVKLNDEVKFPGSD